ncbi:MAG: SIS domain-containing protein, partial [Planctomycetia bacterium]|nr:SIS domain-containing protein [Planctomycetia bacterium]
MKQSVENEILQSIAVLKKMASTSVESICTMAEMLIEVLTGGHRVYICGDGGSAAQAQHITGELVGRFKIDRRPLPVVALSTDTSVLTAVANDYDSERVFERQVDAFLTGDDLLWCLSTSGNSANVLKAAALAKQRGAKVIGFTGPEGGLLKPLCDAALCVPGHDTARVQEGHLLALHILCGMIEQADAGGVQEGDAG